jgi:hypothetical protein
MIDSANQAELAVRERGGSDAGPPFWSGQWWQRLFPVSPARPVGPVRVAVATVCVLAGTAVALARTGGAGPFNSIWAEDATFLLSDSLNKHIWSAVLTPFGGYFYVLPRLLTAVAKLFGVAWMPAVMTIEAALVVSVLALIVYVASGTHLQSVAPRLLVCLPLIAGPIYGSVPNNLATLQFPLLYAAFWVLLWMPARRSAQVVAVAVLVAAGSSTILGVVLLPVAALRLYARRDRFTMVAFGMYLLTVFFQVIPHELGLTSRGDLSEPRFNPLWALWGYAEVALPREVFGEAWAGAYGMTAYGTTAPTGNVTYPWAIVLSWVVVLAVVAVALAGLTRPDWLLAGVGFGFSVFVFCVASMLHGKWQPRYELCSGLILLVALAALARPRPDRPALRGSVPIAALLALFLVVGVANLRDKDFRNHSYPWNGLIRTATAKCAANPQRGHVVMLTGRVGSWHAVLPCRYLLHD